MTSKEVHVSCQRSPIQPCARSHGLSPSTDGTNGAHGPATEPPGQDARSAAATGIDQVYLVTAGLSLLACLFAFAVVRGAAPKPAGAAPAGARG
nr:hypothetical protein [uncultured bacterium]